MPAPHPERLMRFDAFTLDLDQCVLRRGDVELHLRPKAFDTLRYLAEHPGRLLSKDELIAAVWPDVTITDDSLVRCIKDIREALGDNDHRIIKTIRGRGYLFAAGTAVTDDGAPASDTGLSQSRTSARSLMRAARLRFLSAGRGGLALLAAGVLLVAVTAWTLRTPTASAAHYTTLANAITDNERSAKARREALALYEKALALDPDFVPALIGSAHTIIVDAIEHSMPAAERAVRLVQAEVAILRAIKLEPGNARAVRWHGILLRTSGKPERAIPVLEQALALSPNSGWVYADLGRAKIETGRADEAIGDFETALRLSPAEPLAYIWCFQAGMAAVHAGQNEAALRWFIRSEQANPAYLRHILPWRAIAHAELGHEDEARALLAQHVTNSPEHTLARWNEYYPRRNAIVAAQRERITAILLRLGFPGGA